MWKALMPAVSVLCVLSATAAAGRARSSHGERIREGRAGAQSRAACSPRTCGRNEGAASRRLRSSKSDVGGRLRRQTARISRNRRTVSALQTGKATGHWGERRRRRRVRAADATAMSCPYSADSVFAMPPHRRAAVNDPFTLASGWCSLADRVAAGGHLAVCVLRSAAGARTSGDADQRRPRLRYGPCGGSAMLWPLASRGRHSPRVVCHPRTRSYGPAEAVAIARHLDSDFLSTAALLAPSGSAWCSVRRSVENRRSCFLSEGHHA